MSDESNDIHKTSESPDNSGTKDDMVSELINNQLKNINSDKKLTFRDIKRICKNLNTNKFEKKKCSLWTGKVTNMNINNKAKYINFYFRGKKRALHRLLYINFVGELNDDEYLKFCCENKGICCNIHHLKKFKYQTNGSDEEADSSDSRNTVLVRGNSNKKGNKNSTKCEHNELDKKQYALVIEKGNKKKIILDFN
jgi:hypothetical protein